MTGPIKERPIGWSSQMAAKRPEDANLDLTKLMRAIRRQLPLISICAGIGLVIAIVMVLGSIPRYSATETILLDEERGELLNQVSALPHSVLTDSTVQSELEIMKSRVLAFRVVEQLGLHEDEDFLNPPVDATTRLTSTIAGVIRPITRLLSPEEPAPAPTEGEVLSDPTMAARERAAGLLRSRLEVNRIGRSFVIDMTFSDFDPARAAAIARAYGDAYVDFQLQTTTEVAQNAGRWINQRLSVLEQQSLNAEREVQEFRVANNLVQVRGSLLTEQQQSEIASELIRAAAETAQIKARLDNFEALIAGPLGDVITVAALETGTQSEEVLRTLRTEYLDARRRWAGVVEQFSETHPQALALQSRMDTLETAIAEEVGRAIEAIRANYNIARSREQSLRSELESLSGADSRDVATMGRLRQLEAISETFATVYRDYLQRYEVTTQQQGFPIASVQIISPAEEPNAPSSPQKKMMLATGLMLGGLLGVALGALREMRPTLLRTSEDVVSSCDVPCAGLAPYGVSLGSQAASAGVLHRTLYRIKQDVDRYPGVPNGGRIIGLAAIETGGDAAHFVPSLCAMFADRGRRVLVVDAGGVDRETTAVIEAQENVAICSLDDFHAWLGQSNGKAGTAGQHAGVEQLRANHDYILLLLPPLTEMAEVDQLEGVMDVSVLMVPWGKISPALLNGALREHRDFRNRLASTVLDGADLKRARHYMRAGDYEERVVRGLAA